MTTSDNAVVLYQSPDGSNSLEVRLDHETVWLTQKQMADLFQRERSVITKHLRNVFIEGELDEKSNVQNMHFAFSDKPVTMYLPSPVLKSPARTRIKSCQNQILEPL